MDILIEAEEFAKQEYPKNDPKHRWDHIQAVMKRAMEIAAKLDDVDIEVLKLAVIFHDINYHSGETREESYENHVEASIEVARKWLTGKKHPKTAQILQAMLEHSTPHRKQIGEAKSVEGKIIYDADKSIFLTTKERYDKYYDLLYLDETREIVSKF